MVHFHEVANKLEETFDRLFSVAEKDASEFRLSEFFNFIGPEVHGTMSPSPSEYMTENNFRYQKEEQGRDRIRLFIQLAVQCGAQAEHMRKQREIDGLEKDVETYKKLTYEGWEEIKELRLREMPKDGIASELVKLRREVAELRQAAATGTRLSDDILGLVRKYNLGEER